MSFCLRVFRISARRTRCSLFSALGHIYTGSEVAVMSLVKYRFCSRLLEHSKMNSRLCDVRLAGCVLSKRWCIQGCSLSSAPGIIYSSSESPSIYLNIDFLLDFWTIKIFCLSTYVFLPANLRKLSQSTRMFSFFCSGYICQFSESPFSAQVSLHGYKLLKCLNVNRPLVDVCLSACQPQTRYGNDRCSLSSAPS